MAVKIGKKTHAKKYVNRPEYKDHAYYEPERLLRQWQVEGVSDDELRNRLVSYIESERKKCIDDITYFAQTYGFITGPGGAGIIPFKLEPYQKTLLSSFQTEKYIIVNKARQLGVSTSLVFYALWFSIFSTGKRCLVVAHRKESAEEFVTKLKTAYEFLPEWLKPSCTLYSKNTVEFDTKSVVKAMTSNPNAARSFSATVFLIDEAGFIKDADEVVKAITPTVAASGGSLIAISTPNGNSDSNWFYRTFSTAKAGQNNWKHFEFPWTVSSIFSRNPTFRQDQIRLDNGNVDKFRQEYECTPAGTGILTSVGVVPIENIKVNDLVVSHSGRLRKVTATMNRNYTGKLYTISSYGSAEPIQCTAEHPIRTFSPDTQTYAWTKAEDITKNHLVVFPKLVLGTTKVMSEAFCRLMAWYITEGSAGKNFIQFSLSNDITERDHLISLLDTLDLPHTCRFTTGWQVQVNHASITEFMITNCGSLAENKRIPTTLISGNESAFFHELMLGDGCLSVSSTGTHKKFSYCTISKSLAYQVQMLANSLPFNYAAGITIRPAKQSTILGRTASCAESYVVQIGIPNPSAKSTKLKRAKYCIAAKIKDIVVSDYNDAVYNFSVQYDESYIVAGRAVHNCCFDVNLNGLFTRDALEGFKPSSVILNRNFGGVTYEDTFHIWETADPSKNYIIGVDCASNKATAKDYTTFQVLDSDTQEQVAEYMGKLPTEVFVDILMKAGRHYNNAMMVIEANSYSEMVFYLLDQRGYHNLWIDPLKQNPGFQTNRATRSLLIEKLLLFFNRPSSTAKLKSARLKLQMENFAANSIYADGSKKFEAAKGNDDLVIALALAVVTLTPKEHVHRPAIEFGIAVDTKLMSSSGEYSDEYLEYHSSRMGISKDMLANRLKLFHNIKAGIYDGSGLEDIVLQHPVEEFERQLSENEFVGSMENIISDNYRTIESLSLLPKERKFSIDDIFSEEWATMTEMHKNMLGFGSLYGNRRF